MRRLRKLLLGDIEINFLHHKTGKTPLMTAANAGRAEAVELLLEHNADPNLRSAGNASALHWACLYGDAQIVDMLIDAGADLNVRRAARDHDGPAPIHMAIRRNGTDGHDQIAARLIDSGANIDIEYLGKTLLEYAEWHQRREVASLLRQRGVRR